MDEEEGLAAGFEGLDTAGPDPVAPRDQADHPEHDAELADPEQLGRLDLAPLDD